MSHYSNRSSSYPAPNRSSLSRHPQLSPRERSVADRQPYTPLDDDSYRAESAKLYPPTGYFMEPSRRVKVDGKRRKVGGGENRPWDPEIKSNYQVFKNEGDAYKDCDTEYRATRQRLRDYEESKKVPEMYKKSPLPNSHDRDGTEIYGSHHHARLYDISRGREESAYRHATGRMDHFEKYPRVNRSSKTDRSHSDAVDVAWNQHATAFSDRNAHAKYSGHPRRPSY